MSNLTAKEDCQRPEDDGDSSVGKGGPTLRSSKSSTLLLKNIDNDASQLKSQPELLSNATTAINLHNVETLRLGTGSGDRRSVYGDVSGSQHEYGFDGSDLVTQSSIEYESGSESGLAPDGSISARNLHEEEEELQGILQDLIRHENRAGGTHRGGKSGGKMSFLDLNFCSVETDDDDVSEFDEDQFVETFIGMSKSREKKDFSTKLKQFFILSSAGKPIYSLNGSDDTILGYTGLITTIISSFQEQMKDEVKCVTYGTKFKIVVMNKNPLYFVVTTKLNHELMNDGSNHLHGLLTKQLNALYNYLLSILSLPSIKKSFHNRLNYDLRKVLTPIDFDNFDSLCMKLTYGFDDPTSAGPGDANFSVFVSHLLSSLQCARVTKHTRHKLNSILLSSKKVKAKKHKEPVVSIPFFPTPEHEKSEHLGDDLLFALTTTSTTKILNLMKPRNHSISNNDLSVLCSMIRSVSCADTSKGAEDVWVPICLPDFNLTGFLYAFIKTIDLSKYVIVDGTHIEPLLLTITLIAGSKNSFFKLRKLAYFIIGKITENESFRNKLSLELTSFDRISIHHELKLPLIKHFIYKLKSYNQYVMSDLVGFNGRSKVSTTLMLVSFYSSLYNTNIGVKELTNYPGISTKLRQKKLGYTKWNIKNNSSVIGFMLHDEDSEFYCISDGDLNSKALIKHSLEIIHWCEKYKSRLFIGKGVSF